MSEPVSIPPGPPANKGLDYYALKEEGARLTQEWSGSIWTDYNEHDPGVTILEQLCYGLTELSYRSQVPIEDLLCDAQTGKIDGHDLALYSATEIFPVNPVTPDDYRALMLDNIAPLANIWFEPIPATARGVNGLYEVFFYEYPADDVTEARHTHHHGHHHHTHSIYDDIHELYSTNRNLCEDIERIERLAPCPVVVCADIGITGDDDPAMVLGEIYACLRLLFAPEPKRHSLKSALFEGKTPADILTGPLLFEGLVAQDQLQPRPTRIPMSDVMQAISQIDAVSSISNVTVDVEFGGQQYCDDDVVIVPKNSILIVETQPIQDGEFSITMRRDGVICNPNPKVVANRFCNLLWEHRRRYDLTIEYQQTLSPPTGTYKDVLPYYSIQNQFPNIYGISDFGLPWDATPKRKGEARQLKGYLLAFEQLLANFFAQLSNAKKLYDINPPTLSTYFYQYLDGSVPDVLPLLKRGYQRPTYQDGMPRLVRRQDNAIDRRNRFLNQQLAMYAQRFDVSKLVDTITEEEQVLSGIGLKQTLLAHLLAATARRGAARDYLKPHGGKNIAGMLIKSRIELGIPPYRGFREDHNGDEDHHHHHHKAALYVVEHLPMRQAGLTGFAKEQEGHRDHRSHHHHHCHYLPISMTVTAILCTGRTGRAEAAFIELARTVVRANTPAHIAMDMIVLNRDEYERFEDLYARWTTAIEKTNRSRFQEDSEALADFLAERRGDRDEGRSS